MLVSRWLRQTSKQHEYLSPVRSIESSFVAQFRRRARQPAQGPAQRIWHCLLFLLSVVVDSKGDQFKPAAPAGGILATSIHFLDGAYYRPRRLTDGRRCNRRALTTFLEEHCDGQEPEEQQGKEETQATAETGCASEESHSCPREIGRAEKKRRFRPSLFCL